MSRQKFCLIFNTLRYFSGNVRNWKNLFHEYFPVPAESRNRKISLQPRFFRRFPFMTLRPDHEWKNISRNTGDSPDTIPCLNFRYPETGTFLGDPANGML